MRELILTNDDARAFFLLPLIELLHRGARAGRESGSQMLVVFLFFSSKSHATSSRSRPPGRH